MSKNYASELNGILYFLHYIPNVRDESKYEHFEKYLIKNCDRKELEKYVETIKPLIEDDTIDIKSIGIGESLRQNNEDVHYFLKRFLVVIEKILSSSQLPC